MLSSLSPHFFPIFCRDFSVYQKIGIMGLYEGATGHLAGAGEYFVLRDALEYQRVVYQALGLASSPHCRGQERPFRPVPLYGSPYA
jgi:hypothetical protein